MLLILMACYGGGGGMNMASKLITITDIGVMLKSAFCHSQHLLYTSADLLGIGCLYTEDNLRYNGYGIS